MGRIAGRFKRAELRRRVRHLALGLLSDPPCKNCWTIAEWAGETTPDGMQHLRGRAKWDADTIRDDVRGYVVEHLHDDQAVLVVDETGDVKKGTGEPRGFRVGQAIDVGEADHLLVLLGQRGERGVDDLVELLAVSLFHRTVCPGNLAAEELPQPARHRPEHQGLSSPPTHQSCGLPSLAMPRLRSVPSTVKPSFSATAREPVFPAMAHHSMRCTSSVAQPQSHRARAASTEKPWPRCSLTAQ